MTNKDETISLERYRVLAEAKNALEDEFNAALAEVKRLQEALKEVVHSRDSYGLSGGTGQWLSMSEAIDDVRALLDEKKGGE